MSDHLHIAFDGTGASYRPKVALPKISPVLFHEQNRQLTCGQETLQQLQSFQEKSRYMHMASDLRLSDEMPQVLSTLQILPEYNTALYTQYAGGLTLLRCLKLEYWRQTGLASRGQLQSLNQCPMAMPNQPLLIYASDLYVRQWTHQSLSEEPSRVATQSHRHTNHRVDESCNVYFDRRQRFVVREKVLFRKSFRRGENTTWAPPSATKWHDSVVCHSVCVCPLHDCRSLTSLDPACEAFSEALAAKHPSASSGIQTVSQNESNDEPNALVTSLPNTNVAMPVEGSEEQQTVNLEEGRLPANATSSIRKRRKNRVKRKGRKRPASKCSQTSDNSRVCHDAGGVHDVAPSTRRKKNKGTEGSLSTQTSKPRTRPSVYGFILMFTFLGAWMLGMTLFGIAFGVAHQSNHYVLMMSIFLAYYVFRRFRPAKVWPRMRRVFAGGWTNHSYFRTQHTILEEAIEPKTKTLIAAHPHGILCCGMITTLVCAPELAKSDVRFLVSDMLFKFPFVADLLSWA
jgi:hypothetical protein